MGETDDDTKDKGIDWSKATDEQLAQAAAEAKKRQPLKDFEDTDFTNLSGPEFARQRQKLFGAMRQHAKDQRTIRDHADLEAKRAKRENASGE